MLWIVCIPLALFFALLGGLLLGRWLGGGRSAAAQESGANAAADGVVFAVLGLLIAFTFTASASRFDDRRRLIVEQTNALGTLNLRLDVLEPQDRRAIREQLAAWLDLALTTKRFSGDPGRFHDAIAEANRLQDQAWRLAVSAVERKQQPALSAFVLGPLNEWIDLTTTRLAMEQLGLPPMVLLTLAALSLVGSVLAGLSMQRRGGRAALHMLAFAGAIAFPIYVILDLNQPRAGLITVDAMDETMRQLRRTIAPPVTDSP